MKAVLQYRASPGFQELLARRTPDWLEIMIIKESKGLERQLRQNQKQGRIRPEIVRLLI